MGSSPDEHWICRLVDCLRAEPHLLQQQPAVAAQHLANMINGKILPQRVVPLVYDALVRAFARLQWPSLPTLHPPPLLGIDDLYGPSPDDLTHSDALLLGQWLISLDPHFFIDPSSANVKEAVHAAMKNPTAMVLPLTLEHIMGTVFHAMPFYTAWILGKSASTGEAECRLIKALKIGPDAAVEHLQSLREFRHSSLVLSNVTVYPTALLHVMGETLRLIAHGTTVSFGSHKKAIGLTAAMLLDKLKKYALVPASHPTALSTDLRCGLVLSNWMDRRMAPTDLSWWCYSLQPPFRSTTGRNAAKAATAPSRTASTAVVCDGSLTGLVSGSGPVLTMATDHARDELFVRDPKALRVLDAYDPRWWVAMTPPQTPQTDGRGQTIPEDILTALATLIKHTSLTATGKDDSRVEGCFSIVTKTLAPSQGLKVKSTFPSEVTGIVTCMVNDTTDEDKLGGWTSRAFYTVAHRVRLSPFLLAAAMIHHRIMDVSFVRPEVVIVTVPVTMGWDNTTVLTHILEVMLKTRVVLLPETTAVAGQSKGYMLSIACRGAYFTTEMIPPTGPTSRSSVVLGASVVSLISSKLATMVVVDMDPNILGSVTDELVTKSVTDSTAAKTWLATELKRALEARLEEIEASLGSAVTLELDGAHDIQFTVVVTKDMFTTAVSWAVSQGIQLASLVKQAQSVDEMCMQGDLLDRPVPRSIVKSLLVPTIGADVTSLVPADRLCRIGLEGLETGRRCVQGTFRLVIPSSTFTSTQDHAHGTTIHVPILGPFAVIAILPGQKVAASGYFTHRVFSEGAGGAPSEEYSAVADMVIASPPIGHCQVCVEIDTERLRVVVTSLDNDERQELVMRPRWMDCTSKSLFLRAMFLSSYPEDPEIEAKGMEHLTRLSRVFPRGQHGIPMTVGKRTGRGLRRKQQCPPSVVPVEIVHWYHQILKFHLLGLLRRQSLAVLGAQA
jgi:hypothetical protein